MAQLVRRVCNTGYSAKLVARAAASSTASSAYSKLDEEDEEQSLLNGGSGCRELHPSTYQPNLSRSMKLNLSRSERVVLNTFHNKCSRQAGKWTRVIP